MDGRTDEHIILTARPRLHFTQRGKSVLIRMMRASLWDNVTNADQCIYFLVQACCCWCQKIRESGDSIFGVLCAKTSTPITTKVTEGWLPLRILTLCDPGMAPH